MPDACDPMSTRPSASSCRSVIRVLHASDLHFYVPPPSLWSVLRSPKRLVGLANLYLLRRVARFSLDVQRQLVREIVRQRPDVVVLSGDLTCLALEEEFLLARQELQPLLECSPQHGVPAGHAFPTLIIPGNHDAYTDESVLDKRPGAPTDVRDAGTRGTVAAAMMRRFFGPWMESMPLSQAASDWQLRFSANKDAFRKQIERQQQHFVQYEQLTPDAAVTSSTADPTTAAPSSSSAVPARPLPYLPVFAYDFLRVLLLNPCVPTSLGSNGKYDALQLSALANMLQQQVPKEDRSAFTDEPWKDLSPGTQDRWQHERWLTETPVDASVAGAIAQNLQPPAAAPSAAAALSSSPAAPRAPPPASPASCYSLLAGHYPVLDGAGGAYEHAHKWHSVSNGAALRAVLQDVRNRIKPQLFLHGHVHRGYQDQLPLQPPGSVVQSADKSPLEDEIERTRPVHQMLICDPGAAGQTFSKKSFRAAAFNIYTLRRGDSIATEEGVEEQAATSAAAAGTLDANASTADPSARNRGRVFPFPQPPPFPATSDNAAAASSLQGGSIGVYSSPKESAGARGGVQTVAHVTGDGRERYYTSVERWVHDGKMFRKEEFPYTSGF